MQNRNFAADSSDLARWRATLAEKCWTATAFEIHCWNEETQAVALALQYGQLQKTDWSYGKVIRGPVTPAFVHWLLHLPKPEEEDVYDKMTPFFTIRLDTGFASEHYGTELTQEA